MHSQDLETNILNEPADAQTELAQDAKSAPGKETSEKSDLDDLLNSRAVPPRRVATISVQYRHLGRGRPLPYLLKDGEE
jgi:hypothetical protein